MNRYQNRNHLRPWRSLFPALDVGHVCLVWVIIGFFPDFSSFWLVVVITLVMMFWYPVVKYSSIKTTYSIHEIVSCQIHITVLLSSFQSQGLKVAQNLSRPSPPPPPHTFPIRSLNEYFMSVHLLCRSVRLGLDITIGKQSVFDRDALRWAGHGGRWVDSPCEGSASNPNQTTPPPSSLLFLKLASYVGPAG